MNKKILFISTHGVGDVAMQIASMGDFFSGCELSFVVTGDAEAELIEFYYPDAIIYRLSVGNKWLQLVRLWGSLNSKRFDFVFAQYNVNRWKFFFFTLMLRHRYLISDKKIDRLLFNTLHKGRLHKMSSMAQWKGVVGGDAYFLRAEAEDFSFPTTCKASRAIDAPMKVLLAISSFEEESYKRWPLDYYASLCKKLSGEFECLFIIYGAPSEYDYSQELVKKCSGLSFQNLCGKISFKGVLEQIGNADLAICNCNAFSHLASLNCVKTIAIYGPTDYRITGLYDTKRNSIVASEKHCSPCYGAGGPCLSPSCLSDITPEHVFQSILKLFGRGGV